MIIQNKVRIIMDYSHVSWVLGGLFREMSEHDLKFFYEPISISNIRNKD